MYLLEFDNNGVLEKITPDALSGLIGVYVKKLHMSIEELLLNDIVEKLETEQDKIYYKIKGE